MLSFVAALLQTDSQQHESQSELEGRARKFFAACDDNGDGKLSKQEVYNFMVDQHVNISHTTLERLFKQLSGGDGFMTQTRLLEASCCALFTAQAPAVHFMARDVCPVHFACSRG